MIRSAMIVLLVALVDVVDAEVLDDFVDHADYQRVLAGPTDAAGAVVDPLTLKRGKDAGVAAFDFLMNNDAYQFLEKTGDLLITGPTNTNVMDVRLLLVR